MRVGTFLLAGCAGVFILSRFTNPTVSAPEKARQRAEESVSEMRSAAQHAVWARGKLDAAKAKMPTATARDLAAHDVYSSCLNRFRLAGQADRGYSGNQIFPAEPGWSATPYDRANWELASGCGYDPLPGYVGAKIGLTATQALWDEAEGALRSRKSEVRAAIAQQKPNGYSNPALEAEAAE